MRLATESHQHLEAFLRAHLGDVRLALPRIFLYQGRVARFLTGTFRISAITFGRRIFVAPRLVKRDDDGQLYIPGWLIAHEAMHVWQYEQSGYSRFFVSYLHGYWRALRRQGKWNRAARTAAYLAINEECAAREAERAYAEWSVRTGRGGDEPYCRRDAFEI